MPGDSKLILEDRIDPLIHPLRGQNVIFDSAVAALYGISNASMIRFGVIGIAFRATSCSN